MAEGRGLSVSRCEAHIVAKREQLLADGVHELRQVAVGMFPGADCVAEENVADKSVPPARVEVGDMPASMSGTMQHLQGFLAKADFIAVLQPAIGREVPRRHVKPAPLLGQSVHQVFIAAVRPFEARVHCCRELCCAARMIDVAVSDEHKFQPQLLQLEEALYLIEIATRVDHRGASRGRAP